MNFKDEILIACKQPSLAKALNYIAIWETERAMQQYKNFLETGISTASNGKCWDTCFEVCFIEVLKKYEAVE